MPESTKQSKRKRGLRLNLRTFLIVASVVALILGLYLHRVDRQRRAVAWIESLGGSVGYDPYSRYPLIFEPVTSVTFLSTDKLQDLNKLAILKSVGHIDGLDVKACSANVLTPLKHLQELDGMSIKVSKNTDLSPLMFLDKLEFLVLEFDEVDLVTFKRLEGLRSKISDLFIFETIDEEGYFNTVYIQRNFKVERDYSANLPNGISKKD